MGEEFDQIEITEKTIREFETRLKNETKVLETLFEQNSFEFSGSRKIGIELEGWLVDKDYLPLPENKKLLETLNDSLVVPELSRYNFELNTPPVTLKENALTEMEAFLKKLWEKCRVAAKKSGNQIMMIGTHPLITDEMLGLEFMTPSNRYTVLNSRLLELRGGKPVQYDIKGEEHLKGSTESILFEAASTSLQLHLQVHQEEAVSMFNSAILTCAPLLAISTNSPFLYQKDLWAETRIPVFEQAVRTDSFRDTFDNKTGRVGFGTGYLKDSFLELYKENLNRYGPLLPVLFEASPIALKHINLHNGCIWRWVRPIVGATNSGHTLRIEQRIFPAGPTLPDMLANFAFYLGLINYHAQKEHVWNDFPFQDAKENFYQVAEKGLHTNIRWFGKSINVQELIQDQLIDQSKTGLQDLGIDKYDIDYYLNGIIRARAKSGQTGADWQKTFITKNGKDFKKLCQEYHANQILQMPVHTWAI